MKAVRTSAEHHFLTTLERLKNAPQGWMTLYFSLSRYITHEDLVSRPREIADKISKARAKSETFMDTLLKKSFEIDTGYAYLFPDHDVVALAFAEDEHQKSEIQKLYRELSATLPDNFSDTGLLANEFYNYQKLADKKLLAGKRHHAYTLMCDTHKVTSIPVRRSRRADPKIIIVEDDRFTASYTANILSKEYDLIVCRTGEEGIEAYIEHAPDIVFLDIHLPGLSGHETLQAIKAVDPGAFVVMLSVDTARESIVQASQSGARNFLKKPFSKERLLSTVKNSPFIRGFDPDEDGLH